MDVLRDTAVLGLRRSNVKVLEVQLQQTRDRFQVGEVTRTDVAQAEASLATGRADVAVAQAVLEASVANYRRVIGVQPTQLSPAQPIEKLLPPTLDLAVATGLSENPSIVGALHQVDVAEDAVKIAEGALLPQVGVQAQVQNSNDTSGYPGYGLYTASVDRRAECSDLSGRRRICRGAAGQGKIEPGAPGRGNRPLPDPLRHCHLAGASFSRPAPRSPRSRRRSRRRKSR